MDKPPINDNVVPFPGAALPVTRHEQVDWENPIDLLAEVTGQIARGVHKPKALIVGLLDEDGSTVVFRLDMSITKIAVFFSNYIECMRAKGIN